MIKNPMKGSILAALPAAMGFPFCFAQGPFAQHLWSRLKIKAKKTEGIPRRRLKKLRPKKRAEKSPGAYAHINPFHNLDVKSDRDK